MRTHVLALLAASALAAAHSSALRSRQRLNGCSGFDEKRYENFQISGGVGGIAVDEAAAMLQAFNNCDLTTVTDASLAAVKAMGVTAERAENERYKPQIAAAGAADRTDLEVGLVKNQVLQHVLFMQALFVEDARGQDVAAQIDERQALIDEHILLDEANAGKRSRAAV